MARNSVNYRFERRRAKNMQPVPFKDSNGATVRHCRRKNREEKQLHTGRLTIVTLLKRLIQG